MRFLLNFAEKTSQFLVWIAGALIILSALMVTLEVFLRKLFNISLGGADELSGYAFGIATSLGLSYALFQRAHVRVDALYNLFPRGLRLCADVLGLVLLAGFAGVVCVTAWSMVADTLTYNSRSITPMQLPLAYPQIPWLLGWLFFLFSTLLLLGAAAYALFKRNFAEAERLIGNPSVEEQVAQERGS